MATVPPEDHDWVLDLLSPVPHRREAALSRHRDLLRTASTALGRMNAIWAEAGTPVPHERHLAAAMDRARAAFDAARNSTIFGPIDQFLEGTHLKDHRQSDRLAHFAVLFLQWERQHPQEWAEAGTWTWSHWGTKEHLLHRFAETGVPADVRSDMIGLVGCAVAGPYRCKDWLYAPLARSLDGPELRARIGCLLNHADRLPRARAQFLIYLLGQPTIAIRRHTWHRWVAERHD